MVAAEWLLTDVECAGTPEAAALMNRWGDEHSWVSGPELLRTAVAGVQVIDGLLSAHESREDHPWVRIRAVDSTWWDIESSDSELLGQFRESFAGVQDLPR